MNRVMLRHGDKFRKAGIRRAVRVKNSSRQLKAKRKGIDCPDNN